MNSNDNDKRYAHCPFCDHNLGRATEIKGLVLECKCGEKLLVNVTKHKVSVERFQDAS